MRAALLAALRLSVAAANAADMPGFKLEGTAWTYEQGDLKFDGVLFKRDGPAPFPAALISHGLDPLPKS